jgi:transposase
VGIVATITQRVIKGHVYYYLVESARINGKPRLVKQKYLGTAKQIENAVNLMHAGAPKPEFSTVFDFGAVAALFDVADRLGIRSIIDCHAGKRNQGLPVSDTILLAAINRTVAPTSKKSFYEWFSKTVLYNMFPTANEKNLSSQGFWNNMSILTQEKIRKIEDEITKVVVKTYNIATECLLFDNTNFFTYVDTSNPASLPKRGHSKEKRNDLKIVGLSMMVSPDHNIPLFHEAYPGNTNDAKRFSEVVILLKERYQRLGRGSCRVTLVFDKGNNNEENIECLLSENPCAFHFVGGLRLNQCPELLEIPKATFKPLDGVCFKSTTTHRMKKRVYGKEMTVVITSNPELYQAQLNGVLNNIAKCEKTFAEQRQKLQMRREGIVTKGKKPTVDSLNRNIAAILSAEHMKDIFDISIEAEEGETPTIEYFLNEGKLTDLKEKKLGKTIIFTDRHDWTNEQIVGAYRSQYHVEETFRQMKDEKYLSFRPIHHFTDAHIRVHAFYCVLALLLASLLSKEFSQLGEKISIHRMLDKLGEVQQVVTVFPKVGKKNTPQVSFSRLNGMVKEYVEKYGLLKYADKL